MQKHDHITYKAPNVQTEKKYGVRLHKG